jgi:hypothetical protein
MEQLAQPFSASRVELKPALKFSHAPRGLGAKLWTNECSLMDRFTPEKLMTEFIVPLSLLTTELMGEAQKLEDAYAKKRITVAWLPLNERGAMKAVAVLKKFLRDEVKSKREDAEEGTLRYREAELKFRKQSKVDKHA